MRQGEFVLGLQPQWLLDLGNDETKPLVDLGAFGLVLWQQLPLAISLGEVAADGG